MPITMPSDVLRRRQAQGPAPQPAQRPSGIKMPSDVLRQRESQQPASAPVPRMPTAEELDAMDPQSAFSLAEQFSGYYGEPAAKPLIEYARGRGRQGSPMLNVLAGAGLPVQTPAPTAQDTISALESAMKESQPIAPEVSFLESLGEPSETAKSYAKYEGEKLDGQKESKVKRALVTKMLRAGGDDLGPEFARQLNPLLDAGKYQLYAQAAEKLQEEVAPYSDEAARQRAAERFLAKYPALFRPVASGVVQSAMSTIGLGARAAELVGSESAGRAADDLSAINQALSSGRMALNEGEVNPTLDAAIEGASRSIADILTLNALIPGAKPIPGATGAKAVASRLNAARGLIAGFTAKAMNDAVAQGRQAGLEGMDLAKYAITQGGAEGLIMAAFQATGFGGLEKAATEGTRAAGRGVANALREAGVNVLSELPEEMLTQLVQSYSDYLSGVNPEAMDPEQLGAAMEQVTATTLLSMGVVEAPRLAGQAIQTRQLSGQMGRFAQDLKAQALDQARKAGLDETASAQAVDSWIGDVATAVENQQAPPTLDAYLQGVPAQAEEAGESPQTAEEAKPAPEVAQPTMAPETPVQALQEATQQQQAPPEQESPDLQLLRERGVQGPEVPPRTQFDQEAVAFAAEQGVDVRFIEDLPARGARVGDTIFIRPGLTDRDSAYEVAGHEIAHRLGADQRIAEIMPADLLAEYKQRYAKMVEGHPLGENLSDADLNAEAAALFIGEALRSPTLRRRIQGENPTMWQRIADAVRNFFDSIRGRSRTMDAIAAEFSPQVRQARAEAEAFKSEANTAKAEARTDALTGLGNKLAYDEAVSKLTRMTRRTGQPFSVIMFDAANLKGANEALGHEGANRILQEIAGNLRSAAGRQEDVAVTRQGGDEFAVFLPDTFAEDAALVRDRIEEEVGRLEIVPGVSMFLAGGVAQFDAGMEFDDVAKQADDQAEARKAELKRSLGEPTTREEALALIEEAGKTETPEQPEAPQEQASPQTKPAPGLKRQEARAEEAPPRPAAPKPAPGRRVEAKAEPEPSPEVAASEKAEAERLAEVRKAPGRKTETPVQVSPQAERMYAAALNNDIASLPEDLRDRIQNEGIRSQLERKVKSLAADGAFDPALAMELTAMHMGALRKLAKRAARMSAGQWSADDLTNIAAETMYSILSGTPTVGPTGRKTNPAKIRGGKIRLAAWNPEQSSLPGFLIGRPGNWQVVGNRVMDMAVGKRAGVNTREQRAPEVPMPAAGEGDTPADRAEYVTKVNTEEASALRELVSMVSDLEASGLTDEQIAEALNEKMGADLDASLIAEARRVQLLPDQPTDLSGNDPIARLKRALIENPKVTGRPELANLSGEERTRRLVDVVDEIRKEKGLPEKKAIAEIQAEGREILAGDNSRDAFAKRVAMGVELTPAEHAASIEMIQMLGSKALSGTNVQEFVAFIDGVRRSRSEWGRSGRIMRDMWKSPGQRMKEFGMSALFVPPAKVRRRVDKLSEQARAGDQAAREQMDAILSEWGDRVESLVEKVNAQLPGDMTVDTMADEDWANTRLFARVIKGAARNKGDFLDGLYAYWINWGLLSGVKTHVANITGNTLNFLVDRAMVRPLERTMNLIKKAATGKHFEGVPTWGELRYLGKAMAKATANAFRGFVSSMATEMPTFEFDRTGKLNSKIIQEMGGESRFSANRLVRLPGTLLQAADEAAKHISGWLEVYGAAHRRALMDPNLTTQEQRDAFVEAEVSDLGSESWADAVMDAKRMTFQEELGAWGQALMDFREKTHRAARRLPIPGANLKYTIPFIPTLLNIFKTGLRFTPFHTPVFLTRVAKSGFSESYRNAKGQTAKTIRSFAQQIVGYGLFAALLDATDDEDGKLPSITGAIPYTPQDRSRRDMAYRTVPPQSIRIPGTDTWISYQRAEPLATTLGTMVDAVNAVRSTAKGDDAGAKFEESLRAIVNNLQEKTFAEGIANTIDMIQDPRSIEVFGRRFASSFVPNLLRQSLRSADPSIRDTGVSTDDYWEYTKRQMRLLAYEAFPTERFAPPPRVDVYGRDVKKVGPLAERVLSPFARQHESRVLKWDKMLVRWNDQHPDEAYNPGDLRPYLTYTDRQGKKRRVNLKPHQAYAMRRLAGLAFTELLESTDINTENPTREDIMVYKKLLSAARKYARNTALADHLDRNEKMKGVIK